MIWRTENWDTNKRETASILVVIVIVSLFLVVGIFRYPVARSFIDRVPDRSNFDGQIYLRVYYLMREGNGYYESLLQAFHLDDRYSPIPTSVLAWREPALHYLLSVLPTADDIYWLYLTLASATILAVFLIAYKSTSRPILSTLAPIMIANYFASPVLAPRWIIFHEWWGAFFLIFGLMMISLKREAFAAIFLVVSASIREWYALPLIGALLGSLIYKRSPPIWLAALTTYAIEYYFHYLHVNSIASSSEIFNVAFLFSRSTPLLLPASALFTYVLLQQLPLIVAALIVPILIIGVLGILGFEDKMLRLTCLALFVIPVLTLFIGSIYDYYWGTTYVPVLLLGVPLGLLRMGTLVRRAFFARGIGRRARIARVQIDASVQR
jgi:hypothetical protein